MRRAVLVVCGLAAVAIACAPRVFHDVRGLAPLPPGRLVVVGTVRFEPAVPEVPRLVWPATVVALTLEPTPIYFDRLPRVRGADGATGAMDENAGAFVLDAPNRPFYIRAIGHWIGRTGYVDWRGHVTENWWVFCEGLLRVEPQPTDRRIYVGELVCRYPNDIAEPLSVEDRYDPERIALVEPPGTEPIIPRIAVPEPITP